MTIENNLRKIRDRISQAQGSAGEIKLVAVIKNIPLELVFQALEAGVTDIGINRVQEALEKYPAIKAKFPKVVWHMIGHLQRNKVRQALDMFDIIQSVDSEQLIEEIEKRAVKPIPILIEVNTSGETTKFGIEPDKVLDLVRFATRHEKIAVKGLMTIGPLSGDPELIQRSFRKLRELKEEIIKQGISQVGMEFLSMGMTNDFETAIQEGSTLVRIGSGIFKEGKNG